VARPSGAVLAQEVAALEAHGLTEADLAQSPYAGIEGARRPMRAALRDPDVSAGADEFGPFIRVAFELPRGSFATIVLREIMKPEQTGAVLSDEGGEEERRP
jgi:tRNA pseudouridine13 synthase